MQEEIVITEVQDKVAIIRLNRPSARNALNDALMNALGEHMLSADRDAGICCIVLMGCGQTFAAGADISEMQSLSYSDVTATNFITRNWETLTRVRKPVIAAVAGYALGGGCELAMMCDFIIAAESAKFGQPEIRLGIIPGAGGTQRLPRAISKAKAMDMILTGRMMDAQEAERAGLVARIVPDDRLMQEALMAANTIANLSIPSLMMAKECVNVAYETTLDQGVRYERSRFHSLFATHDQKEGMAAFLEKRNPSFLDR